MSNDMNRTVREFYKAVEGVKSKKTGGYDVQATVRRVEDGVAWVHIPGGVDETPARLTINAKEGDVVQVRVVNGRAFLVGNASAPPTDNTEAIKALSQADIATEAATIARLRADEATTDAARAHEAADAAQESADDAAQAASDAQDSADAAQDSADAASNALKSVVTGATTVEKAVSVMQTALEAVVDYDPTTDTTKEYFWHDANGAHVLGADSGYRNDVDSSGMKIVNVNTEKTAAEFGADGAQIGETGTSHVYIDYHSLQLISREGSTYMHISDLRDRDGYAPFTDTFTGDGSTKLFVLSTSPTINTDHPLTVYVDDVETTYYCSSNLLTITPAPASGATIKATYYSTSTAAKAYTIGTRRSGAVGVDSVAIGSYNVASGYTSHAEGSYTTASGYLSHAEGSFTKAIGEFSHAGGDHTIAYDSCQTAIGKYNKDETASLLFAIGNGTSDSARSNAMTVDTDGIVTAASFVAPNIKCGELYLNGNETNVGFSKNRSNDSAVSLSAGGTGKTLATVDLEKGKWIVMCKVAFPDASATSYVRACFNTTGNSSGADMQIPSNSGASTTLNFTKFVNAASTTTYYLSASSYVARTIAAGNGQLWAVKIQ